MTTFLENEAKDAHQLDNVQIGDGVTLNRYSDRQAYTVVKRTKNKITVQRDDATMLNSARSGEEDALECSPGGFSCHTSGEQRYAYKSDPSGHVITISRRVIPACDLGFRVYPEEVTWKEVGTRTKESGNSASAGRHEHYDFNF